MNKTFGLQGVSLLSPAAWATAIIVFSKYFLSREMFAAQILFFGVPAVGFVLWRNGRACLRWIWPLVGVLILGLTGFCYNYDSRDVLRDIAFGASPIALFFLGYGLELRLENEWVNIVRVLIICAVGLALNHLFSFVQNPEVLRTSVNEIRELVSFKSTNLVVLAIFATLFLGGVAPVFSPLIRRFVFFPLLTASVILSFSRTGFLVAVVMALACWGVLSRIRLRTILVFVGVVIALGAFLMTAPKDETDTFRGKLAHSIQEMTVSNYSSMRDINLNWRGYETNRAVEMFEDGDALQKVIGQGFGVAVDLGFSIKLGDEEMRYIPIFHNGYAYILLKAGVAGVVLYGILYLIWIRRALQFEVSDDKQIVFLSRLAVGCIVSLALTMFVVGGIAEMHGTEFVLLLGGLMRVFEKKELENAEFVDESGGFSAGDSSNA